MKSGPKVLVSTVEELDALPNLSVIIDSYQDVSQKRCGEWCSYETAEMTSKHLLKYAPLTVLYTPKEYL